MEEYRLPFRKIPLFYGINDDDRAHNLLNAALPGAGAFMRTGNTSFRMGESGQYGAGSAEGKGTCHPGEFLGNRTYISYKGSGSTTHLAPGPR